MSSTHWVLKRKTVPEFSVSISLPSSWHKILVYFNGWRNIEQLHGVKITCPDAFVRKCITFPLIEGGGGGLDLGADWCTVIFFPRRRPPLTWISKKPYEQLHPQSTTIYRRCYQNPQRTNSTVLPNLPYLSIWPCLRQRIGRNPCQKLRHRKRDCEKGPQLSPALCELTWAKKRCRLKPLAGVRKGEGFWGQRSLCSLNITRSPEAV